MKIEKLIVICSSVALIESFYEEYHRDNDNGSDYKPLSDDNFPSRKIIFWLSQCTYQVNSIILFAYIAKYFEKSKISNILLKIGFSNLCKINMNQTIIRSR